MDKHEKIVDDEIVYLNDILMSMTWTIRDAGNRKYMKNVNENWDEIYNEINRSIYESEDYVSYPGRYDISINILNSIGHYKVFYIEGIINGFILDKGVVDSVLSSGFGELNQIYECSRQER